MKDNKKMNQISINEVILDPTIIVSVPLPIDIRTRGLI